MPYICKPTPCHLAKFPHKLNRRVLDFHEYPFAMELQCGPSLLGEDVHKNAARVASGDQNLNTGRKACYSDEKTNETYYVFNGAENKSVQQCVQETLKLQSPFNIDSALLSVNVYDNRAFTMQEQIILIYCPKGVFVNDAVRQHLNIKEEMEVTPKSLKVRYGDPLLVPVTSADQESAYLWVGYKAARNEVALSDEELDFHPVPANGYEVLFSIFGDHMPNTYPEQAWSYVVPKNQGKVQFSCGALYRC